ncbi:unnamed protein product [Clonostachys rosea f. rosea IK726]|uniref:Uncharacterized protein n=1 Tax=Clonostachys rosea f. rosea IK726 TaxID=1349383 RepID=A0ACA9UUJ5_BIOOC|nr:unnamed protein product [Clonostachys rosea f. rosea IK726]
MAVEEVHSRDVDEAFDDWEITTDPQVPNMPPGEFDTPTMAVEEVHSRDVNEAFDDQEITKAEQIIRRWAPGDKIPFLCKEIKSSLALIAIAESHPELSKAKANIDSYLSLSEKTVNVDTLLGKNLDELGFGLPQEPPYEIWRTNICAIIQWVEQEYWQNKRKDIYDILFDGKLDRSKPEPPKIHPLIFFLKQRHPMLSYEKIAGVFESPSCVIDFLLWDIPIKEAQASNSNSSPQFELLQLWGSLFTPKVPFNAGQAYIKIPLPKRLQEEISRVGKTLRGCILTRTDTTEERNYYAFEQPREGPMLFKLICRYLIDTWETVEDFLVQACSVHLIKGTIRGAKGWAEIIVPTSNGSEPLPQHVWFNDQQEEWTLEYLFIKNELVSLSTLEPAQFHSINIQLSTR